MATIYQRNGIWWMRGNVNGRDYRRTTKTRDLERAKQVLADFERAQRATTGNRQWEDVVSGWRIDSQSWLHRTYRHIKKRTGIKGWTEHMTLLELNALAVLSDGRCAITGLDFHLDDQNASRRNPFCISLDRIDCSKGYVIGNVRLVCLIVNMALSNWGEAAVRTMARALVGAELFKCLGQTMAQARVIAEIEDRLNV